MTGSARPAMKVPVDAGLAAMLLEDEAVANVFGGVAWDPDAKVATVDCASCGWRAELGTNVGWLVTLSWVKHLRDAHRWTRALEWWRGVA